MAEIKIKQPFKALDLSADTPKESEAYNQIEVRPDGRYAVEYTKSTGGGMLKLTYLVSVTGERFHEPPGGYEIVDESSDLAEGVGELRPAMWPYIKIVAEAVGGPIDNLNVWVAIQ